MSVDVLSSTRSPAAMNPLHTTKLILASIAYAVTGPLLILVNKRLLTTLQFPFPMTVCGFGLLFSTLVSLILVRTGVTTLNPANVMGAHAYFTRILPIGLLQAIAMALGNGSYLHLSVAFVEMLKAFTPVATLLLAVLLGVAAPTRLLWCSVATISLGTCVAVIGEVNADSIGLLMFMFSALAESARLVLSQNLLQNLRFGVVEGLYYLAPAGLVGMLVGIVAWELPTMLKLARWTVVFDHPEAFALALTLGLAVNLVSYVVIQLSSAVMLKAIGTARTAGLVLFAAVVLGDTVTPLQLVGYAISLSGFMWYNWLKVKGLGGTG